MRRLIIVSMVLILGPSAGTATSGETALGKKTVLRLKALPQIALTPARISFTGFLSGNRNLERYYCPEVEWRFGDGARSVLSPDCHSVENRDLTPINRLWSVHHNYRWSGVYDVKLILRRDGRAVATATTQVVVR
jgi:hypothetical protein